MQLISALPLFLWALPGLSRVVINLDIDSQDLLSAATQPSHVHSNSEQARLAALEDSPEMSLSSNVDSSHCDDVDHLLQWDTLTTDPSPIPSSGTVTVSLSGTLSANITRGAYVKFVAKYGLIQLLSSTLDLCEYVNQGCPIAPGPVVLQDTWDLKSAPPGTYNLVADAYTGDDDPLFCVKMAINFPRP